MRTPDEVRERIVRSWIESANDDLAWADLGAGAENLRGIAQIGFHAQQAVEKLLKAVLASYDVIPEEHHDLARLLARFGCWTGRPPMRSPQSRSSPRMPRSTGIRRDRDGCTS